MSDVYALTKNLTKQVNLNLEIINKHLDHIVTSNMFEKLYHMRNSIKHGLEGFMKWGYHSYKAQRIIKKDLPELTYEEFRRYIKSKNKKIGEL